MSGVGHNHQDIEWLATEQAYRCLNCDERAQTEDGFTCECREFYGPASTEPLAPRPAEPEPDLRARMVKLIVMVPPGLKDRITAASREDHFPDRASWIRAVLCRELDRRRKP